LLDRAVEIDFLAACRRHGAQLLAYSPLANGMLTGKVSDSGTFPAATRMAERRHLLTTERLAALSRIRTWCIKHQITMVEAAFGYLLSEPLVGAVIFAAMNAGQIRQNVSAAQWVPSAQEYEELRRLTAPAEGT
jgi:aryl-alcohol dehydrogenase-like predicted oxidoreductase